MIVWSTWQIWYKIPKDLFWGSMEAGGRWGSVVRHFIKQDVCTPSFWSEATGGNGDTLFLFMNRWLQGLVYIEIISRVWHLCTTGCRMQAKIFLWWVATLWSVFTDSCTQSELILKLYDLRCTFEDGHVDDGADLWHLVLGCSCWRIGLITAPPAESGGGSGGGGDTADQREEEKQPHVNRHGSCHNLKETNTTEFVRFVVFTALPFCKKQHSNT